MNTFLKLACIGPVLAASLAAGGCASSTASRMGNAATAPLGDLNINKTDIPAVLRAAREQPYLLPEGHNCVAIVLEIGQLDAALGPDVDEPVAKGNASLFERASDVAGDHAVGAVRRTAEGLIPFRGWVRKLSGAERHSKLVTSCIMAGAVRRAYLKGVASAQNCVWRDAAQAVTQR